MIEDSITCSPSIPNKSVRESRQIRRSRRKKTDLCAQVYSDLDQSAAGLHTVINEFYKESDDESEMKTKTINSTFLVTDPSAIISTFKPFEVEKSLAMADYLFANQFKQIVNNFPETQGFIVCTSLAEADLKKSHYRTINEKSDINSSYNITESEMLHCCHQAEKVIENPLAVKQDDATTNANDNMELVNSILDDFSQSPLRKEQIINSWQYTPEFRFRKKPVKNYSRSFLNRKQTNLNQRFVSSCTRDSLECEDDRSSCSSLSIQEDVSVTENLVQSSVTNTNNSQRLCENLLNLTEYYTQNQSNEFLSEDLQQHDTNELNLIKKRQDIIRDIISLQSIHANGKRNDSYNSIDDFHGFTSRDDSKRDVTDADYSGYIRNKNVYTAHNYSLCDIQHFDKSTHKDYPGLDNFNEDDYHDMFADINTESVLQHNFRTPNNEMQNVEYLKPKSAGINENAVTHNILNQCSSPARVVFKTSSEPIEVPCETNKILSKFEENTRTYLNNCDTKVIGKDTNIFKNPKDCEWNDDCDIFLNIQTPIGFKENLQTNQEQQHKTGDTCLLSQQEHAPSTSKTATLGFKTAGGKNLHISKKAQKFAKLLLNDFVDNPKADYNCEEELKEIKSKVYAKTHKSAIQDIKELNAEIGFKTAKGKKISISDTGQKYVKNLLREFGVDTKEYYEEDLKAMKQKIYQKNNEIKQSNEQKSFQKDPCKNIDISKTAQEESQSVKQSAANNIKFDTANGETVNNSAKSEKSIQRLLEQFNDNTEEDDDLINIKDDIHLRNVEVNFSDKNSNMIQNNSVCNENIDILNECMLEKFADSSTNDSTLIKMRNDEKQGLSIAANTGLQTANGKKILISTKGQQIVAKLFEEFDTVCDLEQYENDVKDIKSKIQIKNKDLKSKSAQDDNKYVDIQMSQLPLRTKDNENFFSKTNAVIRKRKYSMDNSNLETSNDMPSVKIFRNGLHTFKSSFVEQSLKSPLTSSAHSEIQKKNLLSLTKRHKSKRNLIAKRSQESSKLNKEIFNSNAISTTPIKSSTSLRAAEQTPVTPNLKEFFSNAALTSTPQNKNTKSLPQAIEDSDLKPITWENNDSVCDKSASNSRCITKQSDNLALNITPNSSNPTIKERIGRLKMYGKAPDVSPILIETHQNCRPSGLRRTRSMLNKIAK